MDVAVTGVSGTLGTYLVRELISAGHAVTGLSRTRPGAQSVDFVRGDVRDARAVRRAVAGRDVVVHLGAVPGPYRAPVAELMEVNVVGTATVLEEAAKAGVGAVVFASTGAATGFAFQQIDVSPRYLPVDDDHPSEPHDPYGLSKLMCESMCARYTRALGLRTICLRVHNTWYVDHDGATGAMGTPGWAKTVTVEQLWNRYREALTDPETYEPNQPPAPRRALWGFVDARDVATAFRLAAENAVLDHAVFLITGDETCALEETPELVARYFPDVPVRRRLAGHATLVAHDGATRLLGYRPRYSWRTSDFADWLRSRHPGLL